MRSSRREGKLGRKGGHVELAFWRNLAIIWLSLFCFIGLAIPLAIGYFVVRGVGLVPGKIRPLLQRVRGYSTILRQQSENASTRVSEPLIRIRRQTTKTQTTMNSLLQVRSKKGNKL